VVRKALVFDVGGEDFGISVEEASEVRNPGYIWPVPDMPDYMPGLIKVRGEVIPVVDMVRRFSIGDASGRRRALIVKPGGNKVGLLVEEVTGVLAYGSEDVTPPPPIFKGLRAEYIGGLLKKGEKVVILLDLDRLLTSREKIMLEAARVAGKTRT
jgi:purine-binding chemotaxis protein CheW